MENPHEEQQSALLGRIVANVSKLNKSVEELNNKLESVNTVNSDLALISHMWTAYSNSVRIHIDNTKNNSRSSKNKK